MHAPIRTCSLSELFQTHPVQHRREENAVLLVHSPADLAANHVMNLFFLELRLNVLGFV